MSSLSKKRTSAGYSQIQLAELTGISQSTISQIEQGRTYPQAATRHKLEEVLGSVDWIATKLSAGSGADLTAFHEDESPENRVIREIELLANRSQDVEKALRFVFEYAGRRLRKIQLFKKVEASIRGEKVEFNQYEKNLINKISSGKADKGVRR